MFTRRTLGVTLVCATCMFGSATKIVSAQAEVFRPVIEGDWWQVASRPNLGDLGSPTQEVVDFAIWQARDGSWQIWSCIRRTREIGHTRLFYRWEGASLTEPAWRPMGIAMRADPTFGESAGGLQAPFVRLIDGTFYMFYGGWDVICCATSKDGKTFQRKVNDRGQSVLFGAPEGFGNPRDPMVLRIGNLWYCYFTAHTPQRGAVFCCTSGDLVTWSSPIIVAEGGQAGSGPYSAECPFVVELSPGQFYLFRTQRYGLRAQTSVYVSRDPLDFGKSKDEGHFVGTLPVAAPELIFHDNRWFIAALAPDLQGIRIARLRWERASF